MSVLAPPMQQMMAPQPGGNATFQSAPPTPPPQPTMAPPMPPPIPSGLPPGIKHKQLLSDEEFAQLKEQVEGSYKALEKHREARKRAKKQYIGESFGIGEGDVPKTLVNMVDQMIEVYMQELASGTPQVLMMSEKLAMKTAVRYFNLSFNHVIKKIRVRESLKLGALESLLAPICAFKVGVEKPSESDKGYPFDVSALPFIESIFFNDFVYDTSQERWELCRFYGDKYVQHVDTLKSDPRNDPEVIKDLDSAFDTTPYGLMADNEERTSDRGNPYENEKKDYVQCWDIYMPRKRLFITYLVNGANEKPLRVSKWNGPPGGPYKIAKYKLVPNEILGKPPVQDIIALAGLHNKLWLKISSQASREKTVGFAMMGAVDDARRVMNAADGEVIAVQHTDAIREMKFGGPSQEVMTAMQVTKGEVEYQAGNLATMGGLGTQADTLGQEQMLAKASSGRIRARQQDFQELVTDALWDVGWYLWNDPLVRVETADQIPGVADPLQVTWPIQVDEVGKETDLRQGEYNDINITLIPYSMKDRSPDSIVAELDQTVQTIILPLAAMLPTQGLAFDIRAYLKARAELKGIPQMKDLIIDAQSPIDPEQEPSNMGGAKPPQTTRTYDNRSTKGGGDSAPSQLISHMPATTKPPGLAT